MSQKITKTFVTKAAKTSEHQTIKYKYSPRSVDGGGEKG
jgi:hypothetical protein